MSSPASIEKPAGKYFRRMTTMEMVSALQSSPARVPPPATSHRRSHLPEFGEELEFERFREIGNAAGSAGAGLVADDSLDSLQMMEPPELELLVEIRESFGHFVEIPVLLGVVIDA